MHEICNRFDYIYHACDVEVILFELGKPQDQAKANLCLKIFVQVLTFLGTNWETLASHWHNHTEPNAATQKKSSTKKFLESQNVSANL